MSNTRVRNTAYKPTIAAPRVLVIIQPCWAMMDTTATSIIISKVRENPRESEFTGNTSKLLERLQMIHGKGNPKVMSKMFEPMLLETAMSPKPCRATITLE